MARGLLLAKLHDVVVDATTPVYPIGVVANLLDIHPRILQMYEAEGLVCPRYVGCHRLFSRADIHWIKCLTSMIYEAGIGLPGVKRLVEITVHKNSDDGFLAEDLSRISIN